MSELMDLARAIRITEVAIKQLPYMESSNDIKNFEHDMSYLNFILDTLRRTQTDNIQLTLDELKQMDGEPVWIQESAPYTFAGYKILCSHVVDEYEDVCFEGGDCYYSHDYGKTWLAYRTKPERSEGE